MSTIVEELYNTHDSGRSKPTIQETSVLLRRIIDETAASVFMVVDALDGAKIG